ncbi:MAG: GGDEF domain-containing protein [Acidimicrobiales bacterium]|jgi:diguanylate cyclase (GGDEF)-like protein/PAS domain S-box-containing protein
MEEVGDSMARPVPAWLDALVEQGIEATVVFDSDLTISYANDAAIDLLGYTWPELAGMGALDFVHPDDLSRAGANVTGVAAGARPDPGLMRIRTAAGEWRPMELNPRQMDLPDPPEGPGSVLAVTIRDHQMEDTHWRFLAELASGSDFPKAVDGFARGLSSSTDGAMGVTFGVDGSRQIVGPLTAELVWPWGDELHRFPVMGSNPGHETTSIPDPGLGVAEAMPQADPWTRAIITGKPAWAVPGVLPEPQRTMAERLGAGVVVVVPVPDPAHELPALIVQCPVEEAMGEIHAEALARRPKQAMAIGLERRHSLAQLRFLAHHDPLTGLANRAQFFDQLSQLHETSGGYGVCYVDLDRFKEVNDTHGHHVGDAVLEQVAAMLVAASGPEHMVARLGGDEFAVVIPSADSNVAAAVAASVVEAFTAGVQVEDVAHDVGASVGVAIGHASPDQVVADADAALYLAKREGRGTWRGAGRSASA